MSNLAKTVFKNTLWLTSSEILSGALLFLLTVFIAKYLGAVDYGKLGFALSLTTLLGVIIDFGFNPLMTREVSRDLSLGPKYLNNILLLRLLLGVGFLILCFTIVALLRHEPTLSLVVLLIGGSVLLNQLLFALNGIFRSHQQMKYEALGRVLFATVVFLIGGVLLITKASLVAFAVNYFIATLCSFLYLLAVTRRRFFPVRLEIDLAFWKHLLSEAWPFALSTIFISIYYYMDTVMLGLMGFDQEVGWYSAAYKIVLFLLLFASILANVFYPLISKLYTEDRQKLEKLLSNFARLTLQIAFPLGVGGMLLGPQIISLFFGEEFAGAGLAFQILVWTVSVIYISIVFGNTLQAINRQKLYMWGVGTGSVLNIVLNFLLIPRFTLYGASVATLASEIFVFLFMFISLRKTLRFPFFRHVAKPALAAMGMAIALLVLPSLPVLVSVGVGAMIYVILLFVFKGISEEERELFAQLFNKKTSSS